MYVNIRYITAKFLTVYVTFEVQLVVF